VAGDLRSQTSGAKKVDWFGFWVRFVCGAVFGALLGFGFVVRSYILTNRTTLVLGVMALILGCAFGAARYGDRFWEAVIGRQF
jgi:hypothetical protein